MQRLTLALTVLASLLPVASAPAEEQAIGVVYAIQEPDFNATVVFMNEAACTELLDKRYPNPELLAERLAMRQKLEAHRDSPLMMMTIVVVSDPTSRETVFPGDRNLTFGIKHESVVLLGVGTPEDKVIKPGALQLWFIPFHRYEMTPGDSLFVMRHAAQQ